MGNVKFDDIDNINVPWEDYDGRSVEKFIKKELSQRIGWIYVSPGTWDTPPRMYAFYDYYHYQQWMNGGGEDPLFYVDLPNDSIYSNSVTLEGSYGGTIWDDAEYMYRCKMTTYVTNTETHATSETYHPCSIMIHRSVDNGQTYVFVGSVEYNEMTYDSSNYASFGLSKFIDFTKHNQRLRIIARDSFNGAESSPSYFYATVYIVPRIKPVIPLYPLDDNNIQFKLQIIGLDMLTDLTYINASYSVTQGSKPVYIMRNVSYSLDDEYIDPPFETPLYTASSDPNIRKPGFIGLNVSSTECKCGGRTFWPPLTIGEENYFVGWHYDNPTYISYVYDPEHEERPCLHLPAIYNTIPNNTYFNMLPFILMYHSGDVTIEIRRVLENSENEELIDTIVMKDCEAHKLYDFYYTLKVPEIYNKIKYKIYSTYNSADCMREGIIHVNHNLQ